jgi:ubiquitin C-terminal hydrolase
MAATAVAVRLCSAESAMMDSSLETCAAPGSSNIGKPEETMSESHHIDSDQPIVPDIIDSSPDDMDMDLAMDEILAAATEADCCETQVFHGHGGIENLGNTCYAAASLQMLASVDAFVTSLVEEHDRQHTATTSPLLTSLLDLLLQLRNGKAVVRISDFKDIVDDRSRLFVGYDQQDAHEFITTLLDLIDTDCRAKASRKDDDACVDVLADDDLLIKDNDISLEGLGLVDDDDAPENDAKHCAEERLLSDESSSLGSATKRPRTGEPATEIVSYVPATPQSSFCEPLSAMDNDRISQLIYGAAFLTVPDPLPHATAPRSPPAQRCKLFGGRMNAEGAKLIPYQPELVESDMAVDTPNRLLPRMSTEPENDSETSNAATTTTSDTTSSPVDASFQMTCRSRLTCDSCKYTRTQTETYTHLSLEIGSSDCGSSVEDGLRRFFAPEKRQCKCEKCFGESATRTVVITQLPKCLLLHFKRFIVDVSPDYTSVSYRKNRATVSFEDTLSFQQDSLLQEFVDSDSPAIASQQAYSLRSVIHHMGASASCGHYTADCKRRTTDDDDSLEWYRFNDEMVQSITPMAAIDHAQRTAYLVLYEVQC